MIPKIDGFTVAKEIRAINKDIPILFLTAKPLQEDKIHGLMLGADDYLVKPFSIEELYLKIEIFLRRKYITDNASDEIRLTYREAELLRLLIINKNTILRREKILKSKMFTEQDLY